MKGNRDMFYSNYQAGAQMEPQMFMTPPSGYNMSSNYQAYGPNVIPMQNMNMNNQMVPQNNTYDNSYTDDFDNRITKLEKQVRRIDQRLRKLENSDSILEDNTIVDSNLYMI